MFCVSGYVRVCIVLASWATFDTPTQFIGLYSLFIALDGKLTRLVQTFFPRFNSVTMHVLHLRPQNTHTVLCESGATVACQRSVLTV